MKILTVTNGKRWIEFQERSRMRFAEADAPFPDFVWECLGINGIPLAMYVSLRPVRAAWVHPSGRCEVIVTPKPGQSLSAFVFAVVDEFFHTAQPPADSTPCTTLTEKMG